MLLAFRASLSVKVLLPPLPDFVLMPLLLLIGSSSSISGGGLSGLGFVLALFAFASDSRLLAFLSSSVLFGALLDLCTAGSTL